MLHSQNFTNPTLPSASLHEVEYESVNPPASALRVAVLVLSFAYD